MNNKNRNIQQQHHFVETDHLLGSSHHPFRDLERRARRRRCLGFLLSIVFLSLLFGIVVSYVHMRHSISSPGYLPDDDTTELVEIANLSRQHLDHFYSKALRHEETKHQLHRHNSSCETTLLLLRHCEKTGPASTKATTP